MKKNLFHALFSCAILWLLTTCNTRAQTNNLATPQAAESKTEIFRDKIRDLIAEGNTEAALHLLVESGNKDAALLQKEFNAAKDSYLKGLIDNAEWARTQSQINLALLETKLDGITVNNAVEAPEVKTILFRDTILHVVSEGNTVGALRLLAEAGYEDALFHQTSLEHAQKDFSAGLIDYDEWARIQARTNYAILEMTPKNNVKGTEAAAIPRDQIIKLLEAGKLEDALWLLFPAKPDDATLVLARLKTAQKYSDLGVIDSAYLDRLKEHITIAILEMSQ